MKVVKSEIKSLLILSQTSQAFTCLQYKSFENTVGKGEIAGNEQSVLSQSAFHLLGELSDIFIKFKIVFSKLFRFWKSPKLVVWERVKVLDL